MLKDTTKDIIKFLQIHHGQDLTAQDVANSLGVSARVITATFTTAIQNKGMGYRETSPVPKKDEKTGKWREIKYLRLNDEGMKYDPYAEPQEKDE